MAHNQLGSIIGKQKTNLSITNDAGDKASLTIYIDFTSSTDNDIINWLLSNRTIAGQRPWRKLSIEELKQLDGRVFLASSIGQKVRSREEQIAEMVNAGMPRKIAEFAIDNPDEFAKAMDKVEIN